MEKRNLDGAFYRLKRGDRWENVCLSDMTDEEREMKLKGQSEGYLMNVIHVLSNCIRRIGDQFDIVSK